MLSCPTCGGLENALAHPHGSDAAAVGQEPHVPIRPRSYRMPDVPAGTFQTSQRLWYRAPDVSDVPILMSWLNDRQVRRTTSPRFPAAEEAVRRWIEKQNPFERGKVNDHAVFVFGLKGTAEPIGKA